MNVGSRHGGFWFCISPSLSSSSFRSCCPGRYALHAYVLGQQKSCSLKRAVAHSPGQQRCYRPVVGPEARTGGASCPLQFKCRANPSKKAEFAVFTGAYGRRRRSGFLEGALVRCSNPAQGAEFLCSAISADDREAGRPHGFASPGCEIAGYVGGIERRIEESTDVCAATVVVAFICHIERGII
jgi:hypothetical protein